ncbi:MAG: ABC transporter ATP-binding protein [Phycisphaerae bacterium]|nr:ABC transporter ATP-binding protein [Phycisphaerae bacterium]
MNPPAYQLRAIDFAYPPPDGGERVHVLRGLSLTIPAGQFLVILGPNGSGKTTLLRCMAGLLVPTAGQILIEDASLNRRTPREIARIVALVPQETQPAFDFTVLQMVLMGRSPHLGQLGFESEKDVAVARECLATTDAGHLENRPFDELSSGERQRVVIARALAQQPRILLLDEPTSFLDIGHQLQTYRLLRTLAAGGMTVVCVSHDLNSAAQHADELALLHRGELVARGTAGEVLTREIVKRVYQVDADIIPHPQTGRPVILPRE